MIHYSEKTLLSILDTIVKAGIRTSSMLQAQPKLREMFFSALRNWMKQIPLRAADNADILRRRGLEEKDVAGDIITKIMRTERRVTSRKDKTYKECLNEALHPQLDLVLARHADKWQQDPQAVIRYLVTIVNRYCFQLARDIKPDVVPTDPEKMPRADANALKTAIMTCEQQLLLDCFSCLDGEDLIRDISILARNAFDMSCKTLEQLLLAGQAAKLARGMVAELSWQIGVDCSAPNVLGRFLKAAECFRLPQKYYTNTKALRKKLYDATASNVLGKIVEKAKNASA